MSVHPLASSLARPFHPEVVRRFERSLGRGIPLHPHVLSCLKLAVVVPLSFLLMHRELPAQVRAWSLPLLFLVFAALDYLDGLVAREQALESRLGRVLDRLTDFPVLFTLSALSARELPALPLALKLILDGLLLVLFARGVGSTHNRLRTTASYVSLFALLLLSQGWAPRLVTAELVTQLLWLNAGISLAIALRRVHVLRSRRIADALSLSNLACGLFSMGFAARGELAPCLLLLALGAALDGLDGAAARRWGGSAWGVYMDDVADGVSYGLAPGYALFATLGGREGLVVGAAFACFVITRLVYFTLNKKHSDPSVFRGVPSTVGGLVTLASLVLMPHSPLAVGFFVGLACALMVSFDVQHRHLGRALAARRMRAYAIVYVGLIALGAALGGMPWAAGLVLLTSIAYGLLPSALAFRKALSA